MQFPVEISIVAIGYVTLLTFKWSTISSTALCASSKVATATGEVEVFSAIATVLPAT